MVCVGVLRASPDADAFFESFLIRCQPILFDLRLLPLPLRFRLGLVQSVTESSTTLYSDTQEAYITLPNKPCRDQNPRRPPSHKMALQAECLSTRWSSRNLQ